MARTRCHPARRSLTIVQLHKSISVAIDFTAKNGTSGYFRFAQEHSTSNLGNTSKAVRARSQSNNDGGGCKVCPATDEDVHTECWHLFIMVLQTLRGLHVIVTKRCMASSHLGSSARSPTSHTWHWFASLRVKTVLSASTFILCLCKGCKRMLAVTVIA